MIVLGIRAKPSGVTFAIVDTERSVVVNVEVIKIPKALDTPDALKYIRNNVLDVLREYSVDRAGVKITEPNAQRVFIRRVEIEGVIQESFASSTLEQFYCGQISSITARIGIARSEFKPLVDGEYEYDVIENWAVLTKDAREAVLVALGAEHD